MPRRCAPRNDSAAALLGRTESSAPTKWDKNHAKRDVEDAVPYEMIGGVHTGRTESSAPTKQNKNRANTAKHPCSFAAGVLQPILSRACS